MYLRVRLETEPEKALVEECTKGDKEAYKKLFETFKDRVYSTALRILGNTEDAEDAVQNSFLKIYSSIHAFRGESSLVTWIYRITANTCLDILRKRAKEGLSETFGESDSHKDIQSDSKRPDEIDSIIEREIAKLPRKCKTVFILYAIEGFKHDEIAKIMEISSGTSKSQYFQAKALLRKRLLSHKEVWTNESQ